MNFGKRGMNHNPQSTTTARLARRDQAILDHVGRYRLTTNEVLHHSLFDGCQPNAVTKVTSRLCRGDYLRKFPLCYPRSYFTLGSCATSLLGLPDNRMLPLGPQSLPTEYGVLAFAVRRKSSHVRLTRHELSERFPALPAGLTEQPYCLDENCNVLELVRVDLGGAADHVARKCEADVAARRDERPFSILLAEKRFRLVVVTATTEKAAAIQQSLSQRLWPDDLLLHIAVVSDLLTLTAGLHHAP